MAEFTSCTNVLFTLGCTVSCKIFSIMSLGSWIHSSLAPHFLGEFGYNPSSVCRSLHSPLNNQLLIVSHHIPSIVISYPSLYHHIYIYIYIDRGSDKGEELCRARYKTQCIRPATTKLAAQVPYKMQSTTWFDSENNSRYALQKAMHLKLKNSWKSGIPTWNFPITFCS